MKKKLIEKSYELAKERYAELGVDTDKALVQLDKVNISLMLSADLVKERGLHAGNLVKELAREINGGGGGQAHFATAGGTNAKGIQAVLENGRKILESLK